MRQAWARSRVAEVAVVGCSASSARTMARRAAAARRSREVATWGGQSRARAETYCWARRPRWARALAARAEVRDSALVATRANSRVAATASGASSPKRSRSSSLACAPSVTTTATLSASSALAAASTMSRPVASEQSPARSAATSPSRTKRVARFSSPSSSPELVVGAHRRARRLCFVASAVFTRNSSVPSSSSTSPQLQTLFPHAALRFSRSDSFRLEVAVNDRVSRAAPPWANRNFDRSNSSACLSTSARTDRRRPFRISNGGALSAISLPACLPASLLGYPRSRGPSACRRGGVASSSPMPRLEQQGKVHELRHARSGGAGGSSRCPRGACLTAT
mmetsp:Transcript_17482/g.54595  ORF Transcript_17482/g.54595 Transcript_17482/m.54595 type:complete len:338 (-) Transcript_17482:53-1066(-)